MRAGHKHKMRTSADAHCENVNADSCLAYLQNEFNSISVPPCTLKWLTLCYRLSVLFLTDTCGATQICCSCSSLSLRASIWPLLDWQLCDSLVILFPHAHPPHILLSVCLSVMQTDRKSRDQLCPLGWEFLSVLKKTKPWIVTLMEEIVWLWW